MSNTKLFLYVLTLIAAIAVSIPLIGRAENVRSTLSQNIGIETKVSSVDDDLRVLSFEVTPAGFEPSETIVSHGKFLILLQNRTGRRDLNFWFARENEGRVAESDPQKRDWKAQVQLSPGTYILGEAEHPEWKSVIRVTN
jgi:hypothetical protein